MAANSDAPHVIFTLLIFYSISAIYCGKLNAPKVLLPYSRSVSTNFTLEVTDGGCFYWSISRPEIVRLHVLLPDERGCSSSAVVSAVGSQASQQSTLVTLRQEATREVIQCEVMVSTIHAIQILTTSRELVLEDTPEMFTLTAITKEGDTFSTLEGLVFQWNLITDKDTVDVVDAHDILRFVKFGDSQYEAPPGIKHMESRGVMGYVALVEGIKTGTAKVSAALVDDSYYATPIVTEVTLTVVANMMLWPPYEVHALVGSIWHYDVQHVQYGIVRKITMPSDQFYLKVSDENIASLDPETSNVQALALGHTTVVLHDRNIRNKQTFRQPVAGIRVVLPHRIEFFIEPHNNWFLISGNAYTITVKIFGRDGIEILATDNLRVETTFSEIIEVVSSSKNGTWHFVKAGPVGIFDLKARIDSMVDKSWMHTAITPELFATHTGEVLDQIEVIPKFVVVPWDPLKRSQYNIELQAKGGGSYGHVWSSSNTTIVDCDHNGRISTKNKGSAVIFAASSRNLHIFGTSRVFVSTPNKIAFLESVVEVEVGGILGLPLALFTSQESAGGEVAFSDCTKLPFEVESDDMAKLRYVNGSLLDPESGGCAVIQFHALDVGFVKVTVNLPVYSTVLKVSTVVAVYKPLKILNPNTMMLLPLGSVGHIAFEGGPRPWILKPQGYFEHFSAQDTSVTAVEQWSSAVDRMSVDLHVFTVLCKSFGESDTILKVGNLKSETNVMPAVVSAHFRVVCARPSSLELVAVVHRPPMATTPCMLDPGHAVSQCYNPLKIMLLLKDSKGRVFSNLTSLTFQWQVSDKNLASISEPDKTLLVHEDASQGFPIIIKSYQTLKPTNVEGTVKVTCSLKGYRQDVLAANSIRADLSIEPAIVQSLLVDLVDDGTFTTDKVFMFDHPLSTTSVKITRGSGIFEFEPREHHAASITFDEKNRMFQMTPNHEGSFVLTAIDRCLESREEATLHVRVVGIHTVNVKMVDKVELGKEITALVTVLDDEQRPFVGSVMSLLDIVPQVSSSVISISNYSRTNVSGHSVATFTVKAAALGQSLVTFFVSRKGIDREPSISSLAYPIQVFSPLKIQPVNITLVIGAKFQVNCIGGPQPSSTIEYSVDDPHVVSISGAGIVEAMHRGRTTLAAYAVSTDSETGLKNVHSRDEVTVYVVSLSGIRIRSPLTRWSVDSTIPVFAVGSNENEKPFAFGSAFPALSFAWSISNKEVARILPTYHKASVQLSDENDFAVRLLAKRPGLVALKLHVSVTKPASTPNYQIVDNLLLVDEIQLQVFENLQIIKPESVINHLLISPKSSMRLATNKDQTAAVSYRVIEMGKGVLKNVTEPCIAIDKVGNLQTASATCSGIVLVDSRDGSGLVQSMSLLVVVKHVSYLMVSPMPLLHTLGSSSLVSIPLGARFKLKVTFHDNTGNEFSNTACRIKFRPSRFDLVEVTLGADNHTLTVRANNPGVTVLRVWDADSPRLEDFLPIITGEAITPSNPTVYLGDRVCFKSPLVTSIGSIGKWTSDNEAVMTISSKGYAVTLDIGVATIFYTVSDTVTTSTEVNVVPVTAVSLHPSNLINLMFTNAHPGKIYHVPLRASGPESKKESLSSRSELDCATGEIPDFVPFECHLRFKNPGIEIDIADVFSTSVAFNVEKGVPECLVTSLLVSDRTARQLSGLDTDIEVDVTVPERGRQPGISSNKVTVQFSPAFHIRTAELNLTDLHPKSSLVLSANKLISSSLQVTAKEASILEFLPMTETVPVGSYEPPTIEIPVQLSQNFWRSAKVFDQISTEIEITCLLTKQTVMVPVRIKIVGDDAGRCAVIESRSGFLGFLRAIADSSQNWIITFLSVIGTLIAIFIGYHALVGQRYAADVSQPGVYLNRSGLVDSPTGWMDSPVMASSPTGEHRFLWSTSYNTQKRSP